MMDMESSLFGYLLDYAKSYTFDGRVALIGNHKNAQAVLTAMLRWQNDQGVRMRREYVACLVGEDGTAYFNPEEFVEWLKVPAVSADHNSGKDKKTAYDIIKKAEKIMDLRLSDMSNVDLHPENRQFVTASWASA